MIGGTESGSTTAAENEIHVRKLTGSIDWHTLQICMAFFSLMVLVSSLQVATALNPLAPKNATAEPPTELEIYQIVVSGTSFGLAVLNVLLGFCRCESRLFRILCSTFQFLWWVGGVIVLTFFGSFQTTERANGYFGSWLCFFFASLILMNVSPAFENSVDKAVSNTRKPLWFLMVTSAVMLGSSISPCVNAPECTGFAAFSVSLSAISLILGSFMFLAANRVSPKWFWFVTNFLVVFWAVGALVVTFGGPFTGTGNGYFSTFAAFIASVGVLQSTSNAVVRENNAANANEEMHI